MVQDLEDEERSGQPSEVVNDQLRGSSKFTLLQLRKKLPKSSTSTILQSSGIWSKLEREKARKVGATWAGCQKENCCSDVITSQSTQ